MGRITQPIRNFTAGELSPLLDPRADLAFYANGCRRLQNFVVRPQGAAFRRSGTRFVAETKDSTKRTRVIRFEFSTEQAYILEFGHQYIRFYMNKGQIVSGGSPYEISTPYDADDLADLKFVQSNDVMYLVHPDYAPRRLSRTGHTSWTLTEVEFTDGPYLEERSDIKITPSGTSGSVTLTASADLFASTDVGRLIRLKHSSTWSWLKITAVASATSATATVKSSSTTASASDSFRLGLWSDTTGWPSAVKIFEERLIFARNKHRPSRFDGSVSNDYENFTPGVNDGDPLSYTIGSDTANPILWIAPIDDLLFGTQGAEFRAKGDTDTAPLTPSNVSVKKQTNHGCAPVEPVIAGKAILFLQRQARKLHELAYNLEAGGYNTADMTARAEHITQSGIVDMAWQQEPFGILWCVRGDGLLIGFTYLREHAVTAWHRHPIGTGPGKAYVESIASIPGANGYDQVWMVVRREYNGTTKRYIELLEDPFPDDADLLDAFFVDCGLTYDGSVDATLTYSAPRGSGVTFTAGAAVFDAGDVGREIRFRELVTPEDPARGKPAVYRHGRATITAVNSTTEVVADVTVEFPDPAETLPALSWGLTVTQVSGLDAIGAVTDKVVALADGEPIQDLTVTGGAITLPNPAVKVHVGFAYTSELMPMKLDAGSIVGTAQGQITRIDKAIIRFFRTLGAKFGADPEDLDEIPFRDIADPTDVPPPLFTGDKTLTFPGDYGESGDFIVRQELPLPCAIVGVFPRVTSDGG